MKQLFLILSCLSFTRAHAAREVLSYPPFISEVKGTLDLQTFPGPPNFDNIATGDDIERHYYLKLDNPVDVIPKGEHPSIDEPTEERNVKIMQLSIGEDALWASFRKAGKGAHVKITGTLFHCFTGHHHARILMPVTKIEELK